MTILISNIEGQFDTFEHWCNRASRVLTGRRGSVGEELRAMCIDSMGRRMHVGNDFQIARDEETFPVYYFWECRPLNDKDLRDHGMKPVPWM